jgi:hypothetical protein
VGRLSDFRSPNTPIGCHASRRDKVHYGRAVAPAEMMALLMLLEQAEEERTRQSTFVTPKKDRAARLTLMLVSTPRGRFLDAPLPAI